MKATISLFSFFLLLSFQNIIAQCFGGWASGGMTYDVENDGLNGKVKQVKIDTYEVVYKFGEALQSDDGHEFYNLLKYDNSGKKIEMNHCYSDGSIECKYTYKHDNNGNMIEENWYGSDGNLEGKIICKYDDNGNMIEKNGYKSDGSFDFKSTYKYDSKGSEIEYTGYFSGGSIASQNKYEYIYDIKGNIIERKVTKSKHNRYTWKYDGNGNKIEEIYYFYYDAEVAVHSYEDKFTWKYDEKGNMIEEKKYFSNGSIEYTCNYKYDYDQQGNWTKQIYSCYDVQRHITLREIEYYSNGQKNTNGDDDQRNVEPLVIIITKPCKGCTGSGYEFGNGTALYLVKPSINNDDDGRGVVKVEFDKNGNVKEVYINQKGTYGSISIDSWMMIKKAAYETKFPADSEAGDSLRTGYLSYDLHPNSYDLQPKIVIGNHYQGGVIAYILQPGDFGYNPNIPHGLIAAPNDQAIGIGVQWYGGKLATSAWQTTLGTGNANTISIVAKQGDGNYAANLCNDLVLDGYIDWYLPSKDELNILYLNRKAIGGFGGYENNVYWSSSEFSYDKAWYQDFNTSEQAYDFKYGYAPVRAVRAF